MVQPSINVFFRPSNLANRSSYIITMVFMFITAFVLAEICSALPLSGSIYIWTAESAGPKYARFFGFLVAWWSTTAWMTFTASNCQVGFTSLVPSQFNLIGLHLVHRKLHRLSAQRLGDRVSRQHGQYEREVESSHMGYL